MATQRDDQRRESQPSGRWSDGGGLRVAAAVAPAVALLLWGDVALAQDDFDEDVVAVPGPSTLTLIAVGAGGAALVHRWRNRKKK